MGGAGIAKLFPTANQLAGKTGRKYRPAMNARDELVDFLVGQIPARTLADFQPSEQARQRVWGLIAKEKDAGLLPDEKLELDDYLKLEHLLVLAKTKARLGAQHG